jgi:glutathione S-transferase
MATLTLVSHDLCPYVQRAAIALQEKGARFERRTIDLDRKPEWLMRISPLGKVPLLIVEEDGSRTVLFESSVICEYIEEAVAGAPLHPADPLPRARHRAWMEFGSAVLQDIWGLETAREAAAYEARRAALASRFSQVEQALDAHGPYFAGTAFSLVDAVFAPVFRYFEVFDTIVDTRVFDGLPRVQAWRGALAARPSVRGAMDAGYAQRLERFLERHDAYLLSLRARGSARIPTAAA